MVWLQRFVHAETKCITSSCHAPTNSEVTPMLAYNANERFACQCFQEHSLRKNMVYFVLALQR